MMNPAEFVNIAAAERDFWWYRGMRSILFGMLDPLAERRTVRSVLEAGCGTGYNAAALQQRYGWRMYPLDLEMDGLAHGKATGVARFTQGDVAALPYRSEAFDAVICLDVLVHFRHGEEDRAIGEFARVLAPGGLLVLRTSALDALRSRHSQFICERQRFTSTRLTRAVWKQGIRVLRCTYANSLLFPIALMKFRLLEPLARRPPESGVRHVGRWLNEVLAVPLAIESRWLASGRNLPFGQSLILIGEKQA